MDVRKRVAQARLERALEAAKRWQSRTAVREHQANTIATLGPGSADSLTRQIEFSRREAARSLVIASGKSGFVGFGERQIGPTLDMTQFAPSEVARRAGRPVVRLVTGGKDGIQAQGFATGFMVTPRLLLTNHHVFANPADCENVGANFLYETSELGINVGVIFDLDPGTCFYSDTQLDFALVAVKEF